MLSLISDASFISMRPPASTFTVLVLLNITLLGILSVLCVSAMCNAMKHLSCKGSAHALHD